MCGFSIVLKSKARKKYGEKLGINLEKMFGNLVSILKMCNELKKESNKNDCKNNKLINSQKNNLKIIPLLDIISKRMLDQMK